MRTSKTSTESHRFPSAAAPTPTLTSIRLLWHQCRITTVLCLLAILAHVSPTLTLALQLDFAAVSNGQWWRIWTGHLTHYGGQHLLWDLLVFAVLGGACERQFQHKYFPALLLTAAGISAAIGLLCEDISIYRGLSGIDTGLFVWFVGDQLRQSFAGRDEVLVALWIVMVTLLLGKLYFEAQTGSLLFVDATSFTPLVESHVVGAGIGVTCFGTIRGFG